jgi:hypothetical protein
VAGAGAGATTGATELELEDATGACEEEEEEELIVVSAEELEEEDSEETEESEDSPTSAPAGATVGREELDSEETLELEDDVTSVPSVPPSSELITVATYPSGSVSTAGSADPFQMKVICRSGCSQSCSLW